MHRRLRLEQRMLLEVIERREMPCSLGPAKLFTRHHMQDLAAKAAIAQQCRDVGMARETPIAVLLPFEDRRLIAQPMIGRIGIVKKARIARIEADASSCSIDLHASIPQAILPAAYHESPCQCWYRRRGRH